MRRVSAWRHSRHSRTRLVGGINGLRRLKSFFMSHKFHTLTFLISSLHLLISGDFISPCSTLSHLKIDYHFRKNSCYGFSQFHFFFLLIYSKNQLHRAFTVFIILLEFFRQQISSANLLFTRVCNSKPNDLHNSIDFVCVSSAFEWAIYKLTI